KTVSHSAVHKSKQSNVQCVEELKVLEHKYPDVLVEQTSLVRNITVKERYHYTHYVQTLIMRTQKLTQLTVSEVSKCGFIVEKSFQLKTTSKEGGRCIMLMPKRVKYRRQHRGRMKGRAKGGTTVAFGEYGLQATEATWITSRQIEAARIAMTRYMKRGCKV